MTESESESKKEILFDPFPNQMTFLEKVFKFEHNVLLFGGAIRGGKTFCVLGALLILCKMFPRSRWAVVRDTLATLKRNTIPSFRKICPDSFCVGGSLDSAYNQDTQTVTFKNGSQIIFFAENFDADKELFRWRGLEVNGFILEEINELQKKSFNKAIERAGTHVVRDGKQPIPLILATMNPSQNWTKQTFYQPAMSGTLPKKWHYQTSRIFDNVFMSAEYIESLKTLPKHEYQIFVDGDWNVTAQTGGEFYRSFNLQQHTIANEMSPVTGRPELYDPTRPIHISFDENVNPYITATVWQMFENDQRFALPNHVVRVLVQIDEFCLTQPNNKIDKLCERISERYSGHETGVFIYGDATSRKDDVKLEVGANLYTIIMDRLRKFNPINRVPLSNPSIVQRGNFQNSVFEVYFRDNAILIGSNCRNSSADYLNVKQDSDGTKKKSTEMNTETKVTFQPFGHTSDANDYFVIVALRDDYEFYLKGSPVANQKVVNRSRIEKTNRY
jgi:hypothetical protein